MQIPTPESRMANLDARMSRIEGIIEQIAQRLTNLEQGQRELSQRFFTALCWIVGIQITTLLTLGTLILLKGGTQ